MNVAVIDLGTNTFHLLIVNNEDGNNTILHKEKVAVRLGMDGISLGIITNDAIERAIKTLKSFKKTITQYDPKKLIATATSAVRNADNGTDFTRRIFEEIGITIEVLSGSEEAYYIYEGVKRFLSIGKSPSLIIDIGGGSIEFIIGNDDQSNWMRSYEIGGQRLMDKFHKNDPISEIDIDDLKNYLDEVLLEVFEMARKYDIDTLIGSSGTFDTLLDINIQTKASERDEKFKLDINSFRRILKQLVSKTRAERLLIPGMIPMRADMIVVASLLTNHIIEKVGIEKIRISNYALKEGILYHQLSELSIESKSSKLS